MTDEQAKEIISRIKNAMEIHIEISKEASEEEEFSSSYGAGKANGCIFAYEKAIEIIKEVMGGE